MEDRSQPNPFSPFRQGPGKPTLRRDWLFNRREQLLCLIEPHWYELEWPLRRAQTVEAVHRAFQIDAFIHNPEPLAPLLRASAAPATKTELDSTRERLGESVRKVRLKNDQHQTQMRRWEEARRTAFSVSEESEKQLREELARRQTNVRGLGEQAASLQEAIREQKLVEATRRLQTNAPQSPEILALEQQRSRVAEDQKTDEKVCADLERRILQITAEVRNMANEVLAAEKTALDAIESELKLLEKEERSLETQLLGQETFIYRNEVLQFLLTKEYALEPVTIANAIAGLPYITSRQSARRCRLMKRKIARSTTYDVLCFVQRMYSRHRRSPNGPLAQTVEAGIRKLPRFEIYEKKKRPSWFRQYLTSNWYFLKRALEDPMLSHPGAVPGAIVKSFLKRMHDPESPITPLLAEKERIRD